MNFIEEKRLKAMADEIAANTKIDETLYKAFCSIPREIFSPLKAHSYSLNAMPMLSKQWISSPLTVAKMTMALDFKNADSVLEIGCGSGYQAAILSKVIRRVFTIERIEKLVDEASANFKALNLHNIFVMHADGQLGWQKYAPFDRILFSAYLEKEPKELFSQLTDGGILVAPMLKKNKQFIIRFTKNENGIKKEELEECLFVPVLDGKE